MEKKQIKNYFNLNFYNILDNISTKINKWLNKKLSDDK